MKDTFENIILCWLGILLFVMMGVATDLVIRYAIHYFQQ